MIIFLFLFLITSSSALSWDGFDYEKVAFIEIDKGNLVREGETIEIYDSNDGYKDVEVENIENYGNTVELEVYDYSSGEYRTFEMDEEW